MYRSGSSNYNSRSGYGRSSYGSSSFGKSSFVPSNTNKPFLFSIIGLALIVVLGYVMFSLYTTYSVDKYDNRLGCFDTIKNMLGMYIPEEPPKPTPKPAPKPKPPSKPTPAPKPEPKKEVFNIDQNIFTYKEAVAVCKAYDAELATQEQINQAYKNNANWCNFGWSKSKTPNSAPAFFITQQSYFDELQKGPVEKRDDCGKPGINGGIFNDKNIKLGANCYGVKPEADPSKITYITDTPVTESSSNSVNQTDDSAGNQTSNQTNLDNDEIQTKIKAYREMIKNKKLEIRPFNTKKWSRYSTKKSRYNLSSDEEDKLIDEMKKNNSQSQDKPESGSDNNNQTSNIASSKTDVL